MIDSKHMGKAVSYGDLDRAAGHYRGEKGYCSVIAVAIAAGVKFGKARAAYTRNGRKNGQGTYQHQQVAALAEFGLSVERERELSSECHGTHLCLITRRLPKQGTFWVYTSGHVSAVRDGVLEDWSAREGARGARKRVISIYRVA